MPVYKYEHSLKHHVLCLSLSGETDEITHGEETVTLPLRAKDILQWMTGACCLPAIGFDSKLEVKISATTNVWAMKVNTCSLELEMNAKQVPYTKPQESSVPLSVRRKAQREYFMDKISNSLGFGTV